MIRPQPDRRTSLPQFCRRLALASALARLALGPSIAMADGPVTMTVAHGRFDGQRWSVGVGMNFNDILADLSLPTRGGGGDGGATQDGPITPHLPLAAGAIGSGIGAHHGWSIDGYTYETVTRLRVRTRTGVIFISPHRYPSRAVRRWPAIAHARYFVHFFSLANQPRTITALDANGHTLASQRLG